MYADRGFREPEVVEKAEKPVYVNGVLKYADPVSDHDFWMDTNDK